jgi:pimeloyl-ACP methyl ester carboxylesterase
MAAGGHLSRETKPLDQLLAVTGGLKLRILRWSPEAGDPGDRSPSARPSAAPYLLVHGLASNARLWDGVARRLAEAGHEAVAVDLRGHGHSDKPDDGFDFATIAGDLRVLLAALGPEFERPILAGQSWGAAVVLDFAVRYPEFTRGIVLVDGGLTSLGDAFPAWELCWQRLAPPPLVGMPLSSVEAYFRTNHADWPEEGIEGSLGNFEIRRDRTIAPWLSRDNHQRILRAMWEQDTTALWRSLRVPALIAPVDGGEDDWTKAKRAGADTAVAAASATGTPVNVRWFTGDHDIHAQRPAEVAAAMLEAEAAGLFGGDTSDGPGSSGSDHRGAATRAADRAR